MPNSRGIRLILLLLLSGAVIGLQAASLQPLSVRNPTIPLSTAGDGNSVTPVLSADGRFVLFSSSANDLVPGDNKQLGLDVFLRDRLSNSTVLVSSNFAGLGGGNGNSINSMISTNGRYVVFQSDSSDLMPGDTNGASDIFVRDLHTGTIELISVATDGGWGNDPSTDPVMTPDGRYVAFVSEASNLVPNDTNGVADVFVRDRVAGTTTLVSAGAMSWSASVYTDIIMATPVISPDGRYVAFYSNATNLVAGATRTLGDVYLRDLVGGTTTWVSSNAAALVSTNLNLVNTAAWHPVLSDDGRFVAFKSGWNGGIRSSLILIYDALNGTTSIIATNGFPAWTYNDDLYGPEMTPDGRFIAYAAVTTNSSGAFSSVHLWDNQAATDTLVSQDMNGNFPTNTMSRGPVLSPDGRYVAFLSNATNLVVNVVSNGYHIYIRDLLGGTNLLVDADTNGVGSTDVNGAIPSMSSDGRFVAFCSPDGSLVAGDNNHFLDVFVIDVVNGTNELISKRDATVVPSTGNGITSISQFAISSDGRWIVFTSGSSDLVTNDFNTDSDVFMWDTVGGTNALVSVGLDGNTGSGGYSAWPAMSADGRFIVFQSAATNLVANDNNGASDIFLRDMQSGTTILVSVSTNGANPGNNDSSSPVISRDGRYVAFLSKSTNLGGSAAGTFWRDTQAGITVLMPASAATSLSPSMSADGRYVAYSSSGTLTRVYDVVGSSNVATISGTISSMALSPAGNRLLYLNGSGTTAVLDLTSNVIVFTSSPGLPLLSQAQWSQDGRFCAFTRGSNLQPGNFFGTNNVYLCDLQSGTVTLVSVNQSGTAPGNGWSDLPTLSSDGRFVFYRSLATDIAAGVVTVPNILIYDRLTGSNSLVSIQQPASSWSQWTSKAAASSNGTTVAFQSWSAGFVTGDLNFSQDAFTAQIQAFSLVDSDGDGIPDWWMMKYFGHPTGQAGDLSLAQDDADGDGMSNLQEYLAGTDPTNPASVFRVSITYQPVNSALLTWLASPARGYQVQLKTNLTDPGWVIPGGNCTVIGSQGSFAISPLATNGFYRVVLIP